MSKLISILVLLLVLPCLLVSQTNSDEERRTCGMEAHMEQLQSNPDYAKQHQEKIKKFEIYQVQRGESRQVCSNPVQLPAAIHYQGVNAADAECLIALAEEQVEILNNDLQGLNSDISIWNNSASSTFPGVSNGEACIELCIANQNHPSGYGLNNGDLAVTINQTSGSFDANWSGYINFYVRSIGALGFSPLGGNGNGDGITMDLGAFGTGSGCPGVVPQAPYDLGRTVTHELGHYFNLDHMWGGNGGCGNDDGVSDTPVSEQEYFGCPAIGVESCGSADMHMSYMDYVNDACMYMFSEGQATRMENYVNSSLNNVINNAVNVCGTGIADPVFTFLIDFEDPSCFGFADGFIIVEADGGDGNFTYTLNGTQTNNTGEFLDLPAGFYTIEIEDGAGTMGDPITVTLIDLDPLSILVENTEDIACFGNEDGLIEVDAVGGAGNYLFSINNGPFTSSGLFTGLGADSYVITVNDENGCASVTSQISIIEPDPFTISLDSLLSPECGSNDGVLIAAGEGGEDFMGQYTYLLDSLTYDTLLIDGIEVDTIYHDTIAIISTDTLGVFENLYSGYYTISAMDANGCSTLLEELELSEADAIEITVLDSYLDLDCGEDANGFIGIEGSNTTGPYSYSSDGMNFTDLGLFNNLVPDSYEFYVMDATGCVNSIQVEVTAPEPIDFGIEETQTLLCNNDANAQITLSASGGTGDYSFYQGNINNPVPSVINNLGTGNWNFIVVDENNCSTDISYFIAEPEPINISVEDTEEVECFGDETGTAQISADGGVGDISYTLGTETNMTGFFSGLTSGSYTVIVTDENECSSEEVFEIEQSSDLKLEIEIEEEVACFGDSNGSFSIYGLGGTGDYMYSLDGVNFTEQQEYFGYAAGLYDVFVTDGNDCITIAVVEMDEPELLTLEINQIEFLECNGDTDALIRLDAIGGTGTYTFSNGISTNTDGLFANQGAGSYSFSVSDENECSVTMEFTIEEPGAISYSIDNIEDNSCDGKTIGSIEVSANGGTGDLQYLLSGQPANTTGMFENLAADNYMLTIRDENACTETESITIENTIDINLSVVEQNEPRCFAGTDGSIEVTVSGSGGGEEFTLGGITNSTGIFTDLAADTYLIEVVDIAGCNASLEVELSEPEALGLADIELTAVRCFGLADGVAVLTATGGTGEITYSLGNQTNTTGIFNNLSVGEYIYSIMDENGCTHTASSDPLIITQPDEILIDVVESAGIACFGDATAGLTVSAEGGNGNFEYILNGGLNSSTGIFEGLAANNYMIEVQDQNGCSTSTNYQITQPEILATSIAELFDADCNGANTGSVSFNTQGGTPEYTYIMEGISSSVPGYINLGAGNYSAIVNDINGCSEEIQFAISEPSAFNIEAISSSDTGEGNGSIQLSMSGGLAPYSVVQAGSASFDDTYYAANLSTGIYTIEVRDANGCIQAIEVEVLFDDKLGNALDGTTLEHVLYPVPTMTDLTMKLLSPNDQDLYFFILDEAGKFIYERETTAVRGQNEYVFDVDNLISGNYVLGIVSERQKLNFKFQVVE